MDVAMALRNPEQGATGGLPAGVPRVRIIRMQEPDSLAG